MNRINQNYQPKTTPFPHQFEAIKYIKEHNITALFDEQGLGKTKIVIDALSQSMKEDQIKGVLIVAPLSLVYVWEQEIKKHSYLFPVVLRGGKREKKYKFLTGANFYITNYEIVVFELERIIRFCKSREIAIVLDEANRIKDPDTKTAKALFSISPLAVKRIVITGTPITNKPIDVWSLYYFLDQGELLGKNYKEFQTSINEKSSDYLIKLETLREIIITNSIRRLKSDVLELPEKIYKNIYVDLKGKQLIMYNKLKNDLIIDFQDLEGSSFIDEVDNILEKLLRLTQLASNPYLIDKSYNEQPVKFYTLINLVDEIIMNNEKVVIWTNFIDNIIILKRCLQKYKPLVIYGDILIKDRIKYIEKFQEDGIYKVLIANPAAAREGITLTRANNAIYLDRNFNLIDYLQSQDRIL